MQSFDTYSEYVDNRMRESTRQTKVSFGIAIPGVFELGFNYSDEQYSKSVRKIRRASAKVRWCLFFLLYRHPYDPPVQTKPKQNICNDFTS